MPLARIITRLAEDAYVLADDLRARGFQVQTRSPQQMFSEPADLEITLEECATEDALERATHSPATQDVCVFIAPGAISENLRPIQTVSLTPPATAQANQVPEAKIQPAITVASMASLALPELTPPEPASPDLASMSTSISNLEMRREPAEDVPAMTHQSEALIRQESESCTPAKEPETVSAARGVQAQLEMVEQVQQRVFEPEGIITPELEPASFENAVASEAPPPEAALKESQPIRLVPLATGADPGRTRFAAYRIRLQQMSRQNKLFWRMAPLAAMLSIELLLLAASAHRFSPVPAGLTRESGESREPIPFANSLPGTQDGIKGTAPAPPSPALEPVKPPTAKQLWSNPGQSSPGQAHAVKSQRSLASSKERVVTPKPRDRSAARSDADYVAKDTVVRYGSDSAGPSPNPRK
jgi:hypothetical protein